MASVAYLDIDQGSDFTAEMTLESDNGEAMNLTGFTVYSQFRKSFGSTIGHSFNTNIVNETAGVITLSLTGIYSSGIRPGRYLYDVEIVSIDGRKTRVVEGIVTINPEITRIP